jgi:hypothetical protein
LFGAVSPPSATSAATNSTLHQPDRQQPVPPLPPAHPAMARSVHRRDCIQFTQSTACSAFPLFSSTPCSESETLSIVISIVQSLTRPKQSTHIGQNRCCHCHLLRLRHRRTGRHRIVRDALDMAACGGARRELRRGWHRSCRGGGQAPGCPGRCRSIGKTSSVSILYELS